MQKSYYSYEFSLLQFSICVSLPFFLSLLFLLYSPSSLFFFIFILCSIPFIFFSSMCHSRCYSGLVGQPFIPSSSSFLKVMMNKDFWNFSFYSNKLYFALNATASGGLLWIYQEDSEGFLECYAYLGGQPFVFHLWAFTSDGSGGPFILGLRMVGLVWSILKVRDLGGTFDDLLFHLLPLFWGMLFRSWASFLGKAYFGRVQDALNIFYGQ